jgi:CRISPR-associated protein (TIGR02710 family)
MASTKVKEIMPHLLRPTFTHEIVEVDLDDLTAVYTKCSVIIKQYSATHEIIADYTGGTKTMSSGLVLAVRQYPKVALSLVTGTRRQLAAHFNTSVSAVRQQLSALQSEERVRSIAMLFDMYEYKAAAESAKRFPREFALEPQHRSWWLKFGQILQGFAYWDNFEHQQAFDTLNAHLATHNRQLHQALLALTGNARTTGYELVHDLRANATRRATQGRYDDAAARVYRALEAFAQARLRSAYEADTSSIPQALIQRHAKAPIPGKFAGAKVEASMFQAYELLVLFDDAVGRCWTTHRSRVLNSIQTRNNSILAHGFTPVSRSEYELFYTEVDALFVAATAAGIKMGNATPALPTADELIQQCNE